MKNNNSLIKSVFFKTKLTSHKLILGFFLLFVLVLNQNVNCQIKEYLPMHVGDYWQYTVTTLGMFETYISISTISVDTLEDSSIVVGLKYGSGGIDYYKILKDDNYTLYRSYALNGDYKPDCKLNIRPGEYWLNYQNRWTKFDTSFVRRIFNEITDTTYYFASCSDTIFSPYTCVYFEYSRGFGKTGWSTGVNAIGLTGCIINGVTYGTIVGVEDEFTPTDYKLKINNYPNPFNPNTTITYTIPENDFAKITIYDMLGREIDVLINGLQNAGSNLVKWEPKGVSSGVYLAVIIYKNQTLTQKMIYQK
ncbi:MAG: T9SS type A sorting domain-containing protein [bacterium]